MPEEVKETASAQQPEQASQQETAPETAETPAAETPAQPEEDASIKNERRLAAVLAVLLAILCVFELGMLTYIGLNVYRNIRTNQIIEARNAAIAQDREAASQAKIQYSGPGRRIVDGVLVSEDSGAAGTRYVLNTDTHVFHTPSCSEVAAIPPEDYDTSGDDRSAVTAQGYTACTYCNP